MDKFQALNIIREAGLVAKKLSNSDYENLKRLKRRERQGSAIVDRTPIELSRRFGINPERIILISNRSGNGGITLFRNISTERGILYFLTFAEPGFSRSPIYAISSNEFDDAESFIEALVKFFKSDDLIEEIKELAKDYLGRSLSIEEINSARRKCLASVPDVRSASELKARLDRMRNGYLSRRDKFESEYREVKKQLVPTVGDWVMSSSLPTDEYWKVVEKNGKELICKNHRRQAIINLEDVEDVSSEHFNRTLHNDVYREGQKNAYRWKHADKYRDEYVDNK